MRKFFVMQYYPLHSTNTIEVVGDHKLLEGHYIYIKGQRYTVMSLATNGANLWDMALDKSVLTPVPMGCTVTMGGMDLNHVEIGKGNLRYTEPDGLEDLCDALGQEYPPTCDVVEMAAKEINEVNTLKKYTFSVHGKGQVTVNACNPLDARTIAYCLAYKVNTNNLEEGQVNTMLRYVDRVMT